MIDFKAKFDAILERMGGLYSFEDILMMVENGSMQSFSNGDSWVLTKICLYPQKKVLEIAFAMGDIDELQAMLPGIEKFARDNECDAIMAIGRGGWDAVKTEGWKQVSHNYMRRL